MRVSFGLSFKMGAHHENLEDRISCSTLGDWKFFGVYDGHGGADTANHLRLWLHHRLFEALDRILLPEDQDPATNDDVGVAIRTTFKQMDAELALENVGAGSTATIVLVHLARQVCWIAHVGDSEARVFDQGQLVYRTQPHDLSNAAEVRRLRNLGATIARGRVWAASGFFSLSQLGLNMTRSFGDFSMTVRGRKVVPAVPTVAQLDLKTCSAPVIVMCSDGYWNAFPGRPLFVEPPPCPTDAWAAQLARQLVTEAVRSPAAYKDDVTACVIAMEVRVQEEAQEKEEEEAGGANEAKAKEETGTVDSRTNNDNQTMAGLVANDGEDVQMK